MELADWESIQKPIRPFPFQAPGRPSGPGGLFT
nr:MAG TPA: hypothetical protein [Bacteriophage sp.]